MQTGGGLVDYYSVVKRKEAICWYKLETTCDEKLVCPGSWRDRRISSKWSNEIKKHGDERRPTTEDTEISQTQKNGGWVRGDIAGDASSLGGMELESWTEMETQKTIQNGTKKQ